MSMSVRERLAKRAPKFAQRDPRDGVVAIGVARPALVPEPKRTVRMQGVGRSRLGAGSSPRECGILSIVCVFSLERIVLGGGVMARPGRLRWLMPGFASLSPATFRHRCWLTTSASSWSRRVSATLRRAGRDSASGDGGEARVDA
jgi:hypothetical protein